WQLGAQARADRVCRRRQHDRDRRSRLLGYESSICSIGNNDIDLASDELAHGIDKALASLRKAIFDGDSTVFDPAELAQPLNQSGEPQAMRCRGARDKESEGRHYCWVLRPRRKRPRGRRATEQRDEIAAPHSITSSAATCKLCGTVRPSALAVVRLITRSYLVGCSTGRSSGFAPRRILSTKLAARPHMCGQSGP